MSTSVTPSGSPKKVDSPMTCSSPQSPEFVRTIVGLSEGLSRLRLSPSKDAKARFVELKQKNDDLEFTDPAIFQPLKNAILECLQKREHLQHFGEGLDELPPVQLIQLTQHIIYRLENLPNPLPDEISPMELESIDEEQALAQEDPHRDAERLKECLATILIEETDITLDASSNTVNFRMPQSFARESRVSKMMQAMTQEGWKETTLKRLNFNLVADPSVENPKQLTRSLREMLVATGPSNILRTQHPLEGDNTIITPTLFVEIRPELIQQVETAKYLGAEEFLQTVESAIYQSEVTSDNICLLWILATKLNSQMCRDWLFNQTWALSERLSEGLESPLELFHELNEIIRWSFEDNPNLSELCLTENGDIHDWLLMILQDMQVKIDLLRFPNNLYTNMEDFLPLKNQIFGFDLSTSCLTDWQILREFPHLTFFAVEDNENPDIVLTDLNVLANCSNIQTLCLSNCQQITQDSWQVLRNFSELTTFISDQSSFSDLSVLSHSQKLQRLELSNCSLRDEPREWSTLEQLTELRIAAFNGTSIRSLTSLKMLAKLQELYIRGCHQIESGWKVLQDMPELRVLDAAYTAFSDLGNLKLCKKLEELHLDKALMDLQIGHFEVFERLRALRVLSMMAWPIKSLKHFKNSPLEHLNLSKCSLEEDWDTLERMQQLTYLNLSLTAFSDLKYLKNCRNLRELDLSYCQKGREAQSLVHADTLKNFVDLTKLNISAWPIESLEPLKSCRHLQELNVADCKEIKRGWDTLRSLSELVSLNVRLTSFNDLSRLSNCLVLQKLNVALTDVTDWTELTKITTLVELDVSATIFSDEDLQHLSNLEYLQRFEAVSCEGLTIGLENLLAFLPRLAQATL